MADTKGKGKSLRAGHRARLRQRFWDNRSSDRDLIELLLTFPIRRRDVHDPAQQLMTDIGTIYQIISATPDQLRSVPGIGPESVLLIKLLHEILCRGLRGYLMTRSVFFDTEQLENYCRLILGCRPLEEFHVLYLDGQNALIEDYCLSVGTTNASHVYPSEILRRAVQVHARGAILVHNHPTPCMSLSKPDEKTTVSVYHMLRDANVVLYDHLVVSGATVYSARYMDIFRDVPNLTDPGNR